jgi:hypothetical protein
MEKEQVLKTLEIADKMIGIDMKKEELYDLLYALDKDIRNKKIKDKDRIRAVDTVLGLILGKEIPYGFQICCHLDGAIGELGETKDPRALKPLAKFAQLLYTQLMGKRQDGKSFPNLGICPYSTIMLSEALEKLAESLETKKAVIREPNPLAKDGEMVDAKALERRPVPQPQIGKLANSQPLKKV